MIPDIHKTVIVTGASQGIGAGLVKAFLVAGHRSRSGESFPRSPLQCGGDFAEHYKDRRVQSIRQTRIS